MSRKPRRRAAPPDPPEAPAPDQDQPKPLRSVELIHLDSEDRVWRDLLLAIRIWWRPLLAIMLLAVLVRFSNLGRVELWLDEITVRNDAIAGTYNVVSPTHRHHLKPLQWLLQNHGDTPFVLRSLGAAYGVGGVALCMMTGLLLRRERAALLAGLIAALHPYLVFYARDGNYYGGMFFYAAAQLLALALLARGAVASGLVLCLLASWLSYFNHPFSGILSALVLAAMGSQLLVQRRFSRALIQRIAHSRPWKISLGIAVLLIVFFRDGLMVDLGQMEDHIAVLKSAGAGFNNIEFTAPYLWGWLTDWTVAFYERGNLAEMAAVLPVALLLIGVPAAWRLSREDARWRGITAVLLLAIPVATAAVFLQPVERAFYLRYLTFVLPVVVLRLAFGAEWLAEKLRGKLGASALPVVLAPLLLIHAVYLVKLHTAPADNYRGLAKALAERWQPGDQMLAFDQIEAVRFRHFFPKAGLPNNQPDIIYYPYRANGAPLWQNALAYAMYGRERYWIDNSWQRLPVPGMYDDLNRMYTTVYAGEAITGEEQDARLLMYEEGPRMLLPYAASRAPWTFDAGGAGSWRYAVAGSGTWRLRLPKGATAEVRGNVTTAPGPTGSLLITAVEPGAFHITITDAPPNGEWMALATPELPEQLTISPRWQCVWPEHHDLRLEQRDGREVLVRDRPGMMRYLVYSPPDEERQFVVLVDLTELEENDWNPPAPLPPGQVQIGSDSPLIIVHLNGRLVGSWSIDMLREFRGRTVSLPLRIKAPPGNNLLEVEFCYVDWEPSRKQRQKRIGFQGLEWNRQHRGDFIATSEEAKDKFWYSPVRDRRREVALAANDLYHWYENADSHMVNAPRTASDERFFNDPRKFANFSMDESVRGPSGSPAFRLDFLVPRLPRSIQGTGLSPPSFLTLMAEYTTSAAPMAGWRISLRTEGLSHIELLPHSIIALRSGGASVMLSESIAATGSMISGTWRELTYLSNMYQETTLGYYHWFALSAIPREINLPPQTGTVWIDAITPLGSPIPRVRDPFLSDLLFFPVESD